MPSAFVENASMSDIARDKARPSGAMAAAAAAIPSRKETGICPTDDEAITPRTTTRSWSYIWKSGVAGGMAGCAVSC